MLCFCSFQRFAQNFRFYDFSIRKFWIFVFIKLLMCEIPFEVSTNTTEYNEKSNQVVKKSNWNCLTFTFSFKTDALREKGIIFAEINKHLFCSQKRGHTFRHPWLNMCGRLFKFSVWTFEMFLNFHFIHLNWFI